MLTSAHRYRHIVFPNAPQRPLNLGLCRAIVPADQAPLSAQNSFGRDINDPFVGWLFAEVGLCAGHYRPESLRRRMPACLRALHVETVADARRLLRRNKHLVPVAINALLLGVTEFFRDAAVFHNLKARLERRGVGHRPVRIWSAGCSAGLELYSVAILLAELGAIDQCELVGTDCRPEAIRRAGQGVYEPSSLRGISTERLVEFFDRVHGVPANAALTWQVRANIRGQATWRHANLMERIEPGPWDVILCRNLAMYLTPFVSERLWRSIAAALRLGGLLIVGKAERVPMNIGLRWEGPCMYRRHGEA